MFVRFQNSAKSSRKRPNKTRRKYRPGFETLETLQLLSGLGDIAGAFQGVGNEIASVGNQVVNDIVSYSKTAIGQVTSGAEQAIADVQNFGEQLLNTVANDAQLVESTATSSLSQISTTLGNLFPQAASAVNSAISQLGTTVSSDIPQITGQVASDLQNLVAIAASNVQTAQADLTNAFGTAESTLVPAFEQLGVQLQTTFTNRSVETGLSYALDGELVLGGVLLIASSEVTGPAGEVTGSTLIGAGIQGFEYNAQNSNPDGTVSSSWNWTGYGENLGIGGATGFVAGGLGALGTAAGGGALVGAAGGAATSAFNQFLNNAVDGKSLDTNVGVAAGFGALTGALFGGLSTYVSDQLADFSASSTGEIIGGTESVLPNAVAGGSDAVASVGDSLDQLAEEAGVAVQAIPVAIPVAEDVPLTAIPLPGDYPINPADLPVAIPALEPQYAIPVPGESPAPVIDSLPGSQSSAVSVALKQILKDALRSFVAPQASGIASSTLSQLESLFSSGSATPPTPQQFATDLLTYFSAATASSPNGYLQTVTSVGLPFGYGTALVGIGGDNAVYVNEQVPGVGTTGWVNLGGNLKSIAVTTDGTGGLPTIFGIGSDNSVWYNQQSAKGSWSGWVSLSDGGAIFQSITAAISPNNTAEVFGIGFDNAVYTQSQNPDRSWSGWTGLGGYVTQISATEFTNSGTAVFAIGANHQTFVDEFTSGGWSGWTDLGGYVTQVAASTTPDGTPEVFAIGGGNSVYVQSQLNGSWTGWTGLGGYAKSIVTDPFAHATVYAIDGSNNIEVDKYTYGGSDTNRYAYWTGFQNLGGAFKGVTEAEGQVYGLGPDNHVYAVHPGSASTDVGGYVKSMAKGGDKVDIGIGSDHSVYVDEQHPNGSWSGTINLGGSMQSIAAVHTSNGVPVVFGIDFNDAVFVDEQTPSGAWSGWVPLGAYVVDHQSIVATTGPTGGPEVFVIGNDSAVWVDQQNPNGSWTGFSSLGGQVKSISVAQDPSGGAVVAAIGLDNGAYVNEQTAQGNFTGWAFTGGVVQSLSVAQAPDGGLALVALGEDNAVWVDEQSFTASEASFGRIDSSWTGFTTLGGDFTSVTAVNNGFGTLEIVAMDSSGNEWFDAQSTNHKWDGLVKIASPPSTSSSTTS
jgi:hypothetical protein